MNEELCKIKHKQSVKKYPEIDLEEGEYVVLDMRRSNIGIIAIWAVVALCIIVLSICLISIANSDSFLTNTFITITDGAKKYLWLLIVMVYIILILGGLVGQIIYSSNRMYVTNMRAIQKIRNSLFSNSTNVIELKRIEDVSFHQNGIMDHIFHMGVLRMSTVGNETTYTFPCLDTPKDEVETISKIVHEQKTV